MKYTELKIFKVALDCATYNEEVVKRFEKYYKYTLGVDLRTVSKEMLYSIHRINGAKGNAKRQEVNDSKLAKVTQGIDFLGYIIRPRYLLSRQRVVNAFKQKKAQFLEKNFKNTNTCSQEEAQKFKAINASFYGHLKHANSHKLMEKYQIKEWL